MTEKQGAAEPESKQRTNSKSHGAPARSARGLAARVVHRVMTDGAFLSDVLNAELSRAALEPRDRALATELSYGVVRLHRALAHRLQALAKRGVAKGDELSQAHLWVAAYQLLVLDRIPAFAAINEAVKALRKLRGPRVANFANAILRKLALEPKLDLSLAYEGSVPRWLNRALVDSVGKEQTLALLGVTPIGQENGEGEDTSGAGRVHRGLCVRLTSKCQAPPSWVESATPGELAPRSYWLPPTGDLRALEGFEEGAFVGQEEGAQWAAWAVGAKPGEKVLDACAGHGQKSTLLAERIGAEGELWVSDIRASKLKDLCVEFDKLELPRPQCRVINWSESGTDRPQDMDRVLVDVPCTGTGTLRRRPEISLRLSKEDPARLGAQSAEILREAAACARPGGRVLFVVCSVLREECEAVVDAVKDVLTPVPFDSPEATALLGEGVTQTRLLPAEHGTDGYFVASFIKAPGSPPE